jgi:hypothetical protein
MFRFLPGKAPREVLTAIPLGRVGYSDRVVKREARRQKAEIRRQKAERSGQG